jgi:hypothetical protein
MASRRSQRTDDGTPLVIIQEELFELQRQRRQVALATPPGPPPDMPYYASVTAPSSQNPSSNFKNTPLPPQQPSSPQQSQQQQQQQQETPKLKSALKKKNKSVAVVDLQDPMDVPYTPSLVQERVSSESVRKVKIGLMLTLFIFICLYIYPVMTNVPNDKRMSALSVLAYAIGLGALGAGLYGTFQAEKE